MAEDALDLIDRDHAFESITLHQQLASALSRATAADEDYRDLSKRAAYAEEALRSAVAAVDVLQARLAGHWGLDAKFVPDAALPPRSAASGTSSVSDTGPPPVRVSGTPHAAPVVVHADGPSVSPAAENDVQRTVRTTP